MTGTAWVELTRRNARSVQTTIGWIDFDPGAMDRYEALSGWHAVNCLREWRGDTHGAIVVANGLTGRRGQRAARPLARRRARVAPALALGEAESVRFHEALEPPGELLPARVDETAGPSYQPGSRIRA